ncbi:hypothetical protein A9Q99_06900 [Gammaproteobacteria bacterium 45_16_T64]|nr:hypothetical protein A9Q99_06900 [Gammaproteobacteria bacterium 45_16_T64]
MSGVVEFESNGLLDPPSGTVLHPILPSNGMATIELGPVGANLSGWQVQVDGTQVIRFNYIVNSMTQYAAPLWVNELSQDGQGIDESCFEE